MAEPTVADHISRWLGIGSSVVAPLTLLTTLLFYFGYVSSRAQFRYFGIDVDTIGLSTTDYAMRSPTVLLVPLLLVALAGMTLLVVHVRVRRHPPSHWSVTAVMVLTLLLLAAGLLLLLAFDRFGHWPPYGLVTPALIGTAVAVATYLFWVPTAPSWLHRSEDERARWVRPAVSALGVVVVATCLFWATATLAEWTGRGNAMRTAQDLDQLPLVILDTSERLFLTDGITQESTLPAGEGDIYRYRYRGLRLLIQGEERLFLVPERWSPHNSTVMVPLDDTVRLQFRFVNDAP